MSVTAADLGEYVAPGMPVTEYMTRCLDVAALLVASQIGSGANIPTTIVDRATLEVAAELYHRKNAPNGVKNFADGFDGAAIRVARDALVAARPLLAPYLPMGFA
jgi:hypothetical protein